MQDIITPTTNFAKDWGSSATLLNKFLLALLHIVKDFTFKLDTLDVILVSVFVDGN